jgi:uncharacterized protein YcaQ
MRRERDGDSRIRAMAVDHADAIVEMRALLRERDVVSNRDFEMATRTRTQSYRGRKDSALALYYLWRTGEVMTHHRERFERVYALTEKVVSAHLIREPIAPYGPFVMNTTQEIQQAIAELRNGTFIR